MGLSQTEPQIAILTISSTWSRAMSSKLTMQQIDLIKVCLQLERHGILEHSEMISVTWTIKRIWLLKTPKGCSWILNASLHLIEAREWWLIDFKAILKPLAKVTPRFRKKLSGMYIWLSLQAWAVNKTFPVTSVGLGAEQNEVRAGGRMGNRLIHSFVYYRLFSSSLLFSSFNRDNDLANLE